MFLIYFFVFAMIVAVVVGVIVGVIRGIKLSREMPRKKREPLDQKSKVLILIGVIMCVMIVLLLLTKW